MGFLSANFQREGKGVSKDTKAPRFILFFQIIGRRFWNLITLNLIYILFCIPIVTIGPATAAMTKIVRNYAREEHAFLWGDFVETFKSNWKQAAVFGFMDFFVYLFLVYDFYILSQLLAQETEKRAILTISLAAIIFTALVWTFMRNYIYNMMVTFKLTVKQLLKNAFIFCWVGFFRNILTVLLCLAFAAILYSVAVYNPLFLIFFALFIFFSFTCFIVNFMVNPLIKKYMIDGYDPETGEKIKNEKYEGFDEVSASEEKEEDE